MLADARAKGYTRFDKVILVGGATRMPQVRNRLVAELNMEPEIYDPDEAVAKGAALYALKESLLDQVAGFPLDQGRRRRQGRPSRSIMAHVSEEEVTQALDHLEKELGFTLTGPVRELVNTRIVNVLSQEPGRHRAQRAEPGRRLLPLAAQFRGAARADHRLRDRRRQPVGGRHSRHVRRARQPRPARLPGSRRRHASTCPSGCRPRARSASSSPSTKTAGSASRQPT